MHLFTATELNATYGDPGPGPDAATPKWIRDNIVTCRAVQGDRETMPGVPPSFYFMTHKLVEERMRVAFAAARAADPQYAIVRAASFVYRHKRHNPKLALSHHSWGVAVDIDSDKNAGHDFKPHQYVEPWSPEWRHIWPKGLRQPFVEAFECNGFIWGGRWTDYCDPMHFEIGKP